MKKKLNGVGPVDNRPSTNNLHNFVQKKCDMWHGEGEHSLKMLAPLLSPFVISDIMKI